MPFHAEGRVIGRTWGDLGIVMPPLPQLVDHTAGERRAMRGTECFRIEDVSDLAIHLLLAI